MVRADRDANPKAALRVARANLSAIWFVAAPAAPGAPAEVAAALTPRFAVMPEGVAGARC